MNASLKGSQVWGINGVNFWGLEISFLVVQTVNQIWFAQCFAQSTEKALVLNNSQLPATNTVFAWYWWKSSTNCAPCRPLCTLLKVRKADRTRNAMTTSSLKKANALRHGITKLSLQCRASVKPVTITHTWRSSRIRHACSAVPYFRRRAPGGPLKNWLRVLGVKKGGFGISLGAQPHKVHKGRFCGTL